MLYFWRSDSAAMSKVSLCFPICIVRLAWYIKYIWKCSGSAQPDQIPDQDVFLLHASPWNSEECFCFSVFNASLQQPPKPVLFVISVSWNKISSGHFEYLDLINPLSLFLFLLCSSSTSSMLSVCNRLWHWVHTWIHLSCFALLSNPRLGGD